MTTAARAIVNGQWANVPKTRNDAIKSGWHCAFEYNAFNVFDAFPYDDFENWCKETFQFGTYVLFTSGAWFLNESDVLLARLKWV